MASKEKVKYDIPAGRVRQIAVMATHELQDAMESVSEETVEETPELVVGDLIHSAQMTHRQMRSIVENLEVQYKEVHDDCRAFEEFWEVEGNLQDRLDEVEEEY